MSIGPVRAAEVLRYSKQQHKSKTLARSMPRFNTYGLLYSRGKIAIGHSLWDVVDI